MKKPYCTQNDGDCLTCSLVNYGRDCLNNPVDYLKAAASALSKSKAGKPKAAQASRDNGKRGGRPRDNKTPRCHRDGTVSYWSVYRQSFVRRADDISDEELAAMNADDRARVIAHME